MPRQGTTTTTTTTQPPAGASPDAVAWRLSQVESGLKDLFDKLDAITVNFATHKDIETVRVQSKFEHDAIYERIGDVDTQVKGVKKEVKDIKTRNWIQNTLSAILGSVLTFLLIYFLNNISRG